MDGQRCQVCENTEMICGALFRWQQTRISQAYIGGVVFLFKDINYIILKQ